MSKTTDKYGNNTYGLKCYEDVEEHRFMSLSWEDRRQEILDAQNSMTRQEKRKRRESMQNVRNIHGI